MVSCLSHYIRNSIPETVRTLYVFTDGCRGQNHNHTMLNYLQTLVLNGRFDKVVHRLPVRGHNVLPCDREFGVIEKLQRKREVVEIYSEWEDMIRERFDGTSMTGKDMFDFKSHFSAFLKKVGHEKRREDVNHEMQNFVIFCKS